MLNLGENGQLLDKPGKKERENMAHTSGEKNKDLTLVSTCTRKTEQPEKTETKQKTRQNPTTEQKRNGGEKTPNWRSSPNTINGRKIR
jgi:hypothetical protein